MAERPDGVEVSVRLGCGALFGAVVALPIAGSVVARLFGPEELLVPMLVAGGVVVVLCAALAVKFGDRFWDRWIESRSRWFDP